MANRSGDRPARIIGVGQISYGRNVAVNDNVRLNTIPYVSGALSGLERIQMSRDGPVSCESLATAVFYEHRTLVDQTILSTPFLPNIDGFNENIDVALESLNRLERTFENNRVYHHPVFNGSARREFLIYNFQIDGGWAAMVARIAEVPGYIYHAGQRILYQHCVTDAAFIDPRVGLDNRDADRRQRIVENCSEFLRHGSIMPLDAGRTQFHQLRHPTCGDNPNLTGYWLFGINRELIRRLRVVLNTRAQPLTGLDNQVNPPPFWANIEEDWNVDMLRQAMLGNNALRAVQMSDHAAYIALAVPDDISRRELPDLQPGVVMPNLHPDELFRGFDNEGPALVWTSPDAPGGPPTPITDSSSDSHGSEPPPPYWPPPSSSSNSDSSGGSWIPPSSSSSSDSSGGAWIPPHIRRGGHSIFYPPPSSDGGIIPWTVYRGSTGSTVPPPSSDGGILPCSMYGGSPGSAVPPGMDLILQAPVPASANPFSVSNFQSQFFPPAQGTKRARDGDDSMDTSSDSDYQPNDASRALKRRRQHPSPAPNPLVSRGSTVTRIRRSPTRPLWS